MKKWFEITTGLTVKESAFFLTWLVMILGVATSVSFGLAYAVFVNNCKFVIINIPTLYLLLFGVSAFQINQNSLPVYLKWFNDICFISRLGEAYGVIHLPLIASTSCNSSTLKFNCFNEEGILNKYGFKRENLAESLWVLPLTAFSLFIISNIWMFLKSKFNKA